MHVLHLPGRAALSSFRLDKLNSAIAAAGVDTRVLGATHWHFAEVEDVLDGRERQVLERLLDYGPTDPDDGIPTETRAYVLVAPRLGTISPWSSKATDIFHNCGLNAVRRVERGLHLRVRAADGRELAPSDLAPAASLLHDRIPCHVVQVGGEHDDDLIVVQDVAGLVAKRYDGRPGTCYLMRPDGIVCARWRSFDAAAVRAAIARATARA